MCRKWRLYIHVYEFMYEPFALPKKITIDILKTTFKDASTFNQEMQADNMVSFIQFKLMLSLVIYRVFKCS